MSKPKVPPTAPERALPLPATSSRALPYRVTIRLPGADPSAPAEALTRALRTAGVPFEVETIERMGEDKSSATPAPAATGGTPATAVPGASARPAPTPR